MFKNKLSKKSNKSYEDIHYSCTIRFLDDSEPLSVTFQKDTKGLWLIDQVCTQLNLLENDYFGLRYVDTEKQRHWLDPTKSVYRQLKNVHPMVLCFRVKFYPAEPMKLKEEITRYFLFLQLRRDLHHGRLLCSPGDANQLAAYIVQSEVGDYDPQDHPSGYVTDFKMLPKQTQKQEEKIAEIHKSLEGEVPSESEGNFLKKASELDTYGVDPHPVKPKQRTLRLSGLNLDQKGNQMYLGVTHLGIVTFQGNKRTHLFKWGQITKIAFEGKMFIVHVTISEGEENALFMKRKKHACGFKCPTFSACKHLWKCAVEQQYFFTLGSSAEVPKVTSGGGFFTRGSKFRFSGRCQREVYVDSAGITRDEPMFIRSSSNPQFVRSYGKLRSQSLPSKLKDRAQAQHGEVIIDGNNISSSFETTAMSGDFMSEPVEETIPEETAVEVANTPYNPLISPLREDLPAFPASDDSLPLAEPASGPPPDLDAQIQELQNELERCKTDGPLVTANHVHYNELPVDVGDVVQPAPSDFGLVGDQPEEGATVVAGAEVEEEEAAVTPAVADDPTIAAQQQRGLSCCRTLTILFFVVFTVMAIMVFFLLESELEVPVLKDIRQMPEVQDFKMQHYDPFKTTVTQKMGGLFNR